MPSILPLTGIFTLVALALGLVYWNIYSNSASTMTTRNNMSVAVRNCRTSCCKEQKYTALAKYVASNSSSPKRCYKKISLSIFGENVFSFQPLSDDTSCDHIMRRGVNDASCQSSYYNMSRRATECAQTSSFLRLQEFLGGAEGGGGKGGVSIRGEGIWNPPTHPEP